MRPLRSRVRALPRQPGEHWVTVRIHPDWLNADCNFDLYPYAKEWLKNNCSPNEHLVCLNETRPSGYVCFLSMKPAHEFASIVDGYATVLDYLVAGYREFVEVSVPVLFYSDLLAFGHTMRDDCRQWFQHNIKGPWAISILPEDRDYFWMLDYNPRVRYGVAFFKPEDAIKFKLKFT